MDDCSGCFFDFVLFVLLVFMYGMAGLCCSAWYRSAVLLLIVVFFWSIPSILQHSGDSHWLLTGWERSGDPQVGWTHVFIFGD